MSSIAAKFPWQRHALISGASSGLGRCLYERWGGRGLTRDNAEVILQKLRRRGASVIVHCAANPRRAANLSDLLQIHQDNVMLTQRLLAIPHERFVFISTIAVLPIARARHLDPDLPRTPYAASKLLGEALVSAGPRPHLILRPTMMLGRTMRPNAVSRVLDGQATSLAAESRVNLILHEDVALLIERALRDDVTGICHLASSKSISLLRIARLYRTRPRFGAFVYRAPRVDADRARKLVKGFARSSEQVLERFVRERTE